MEVSSAQKQGEWKLRNTLLIPNSKLLFSSKNNLEYTTTKKVASREVWLEWNSSKNLWVYTSGPDSQRGACNFWVFTWGPSPSIAAGCLHLEPAQLLHPYFAPSINSTLAKFQPLQWVFTCGPSLAATLITTYEVMQIKTEKVLKVKVWSRRVYKSLVIVGKIVSNNLPVLWAWVWRLERS